MISMPDDLFIFGKFSFYLLSVHVTVYLNFNLISLFLNILWGFSSSLIDCIKALFHLLSQLFLSHFKKREIKLNIMTPSLILY